MTLRRVLPLLLPLAAILITALPAQAAGSPEIVAPATGVRLDLNRCATPGTPLQTGTPAASLASVISTGGYVICSCQLCSQSDVICRISPSGFSIPCADYYQTHCVG